MATAPPAPASPCVVRPMRADDVPAADLAYRLAFGTAFRLPDPSRFRGDGAVIGNRRLAWPEGAFVAERDGAVIGSLTGNHWGSVVVLGPLTVHPDHWNGGVARALLAPFLALPAVRSARLTVLFTFPDSPKHIALYERHGFAPRPLNAVLSITPVARAGVGWRGIGALDDTARRDAIAGCRAVAEANFAGLDLTREIEAVRARSLGETVIVDDADGRPAGFAICHAGAGTEAGSGFAFVKFAATRPGDTATFERLVAACEAFACARGATTLRAGVNFGRRRVYGMLRARGWRIDLTGLTMHRPDADAWASDASCVLDDWR